jgi:hypothetical protein
VNRFLTGIAAATAVIGCALASTTYANANTYDFSYSFGSSGPGEVTGSFNGTPDPSIAGDVDITSVNGVYFNGHALSGPLYAWQYTDVGGDCSTCWSLGGAVASLTNPLNNNFLFINSNAPGFPGYTNYFYIIPWPNGASNPEAVQFYSNPNFVPANQYNGDFIAANLNITQTPLPSTWTMLILGFVGLGYFACRGSKKSAFAPLAA